MNSNKKLELFIIENRIVFDNQIPPEGHAKRFENKLYGLNKNKKNNRIISWKFMAIAASVGFVIMSLVSVYFYSSNKTTYAILETDRNQMKETMILSLIENQSASKRLKAVNYIGEYNEPADEIISALIKTLYHDDNSNVRLSSAEGLSKFSYRNDVKKALSEALIFEKDPNVQIELIHILIAIKEKSAIGPMQGILKNKNTPEFMKEQLKNGISELMTDKI